MSSSSSDTKSPKQHRRPCPTCPFIRSSEPGATGGSPPSVYVAQTLLPYKIPCHEFIDYSDPEWKESCLQGVPQCVGHAMLRDAIGVAERLPEALLRVVHDPDTGAFTSLAEFWAHHTGESLEEARALLSPAVIRAMILAELSRAGLKQLNGSGKAD